MTVGREHKREHEQNKLDREQQREDAVGENLCGLSARSGRARAHRPARTPR